jgi:hypothetical protein
MSNFKANNKMSAFEVFKHRLMYGGFAYSESGEINIVPELTKNFWFVENLFYGRIREKSGEISIIAPKEELLVNCKHTASPAPVKALDFVADAFEHLLVEYGKNRMQGKVSENSEYLSRLLAHGGATPSYRSPREVRRGVSSRLLPYCQTLQDEIVHILSFEDFVPFFMEFLEHLVKVFPVNRSSYLISKYSSPTASGLCLEVLKLDHSKDSEKSKFLNDENFQIYKILAAASGFAIDKNAPWRLVADIASKRMLEFAASRVPGINTAEDILDYYFEDVRSAIGEYSYDAWMFSKSYTALKYDEFEEFKKIVIQAYDFFVATYPTVSEKSVGSDRVISAQQKERTRESLESILARIGNDFWYEKYLAIKNIELGLGYSSLEINKIAKNAADLEFSFDRSRAAGYIKKRMTPIVSSEGSLVYSMLKINEENIKVSPKEDAQSLARSLNKKIY